MSIKYIKPPKNSFNDKEATVFFISNNKRITTIYLQIIQSIASVPELLNDPEGGLYAKRIEYK